jgi:dCMP deaminase
MAFDLSKLTKYMEIVDATAKLSKDASTKVGALILGPSFEVRSIGYNGAPRGCSADEDERGTTRPEKYFWFSHAELNAITNAARVGTPLDNCSLLVTHPPCMDCARAIVQAGIVCVIARDPGAEFLERWIEHTRRTQALFKECQVDYVMV